MIRIKSTVVSLATALALGSAASHAAIVWDWSPQATGGTVTSDNWSNESPGQHFAERVSFAAATSITGIDIYNNAAWGTFGTAVKITIWENSGGQPGNVLAQYQTSVTIADTDGAVGGQQHRLHADFAAFAMAANVDYWIGMAGDGTSLTQTGLQGVAGGDSRMAQFNSNDVFSYFTDVSVGDMAFRLHGDAGAVPAPLTASLVLAGLAAAGATRRRQG